MSWDMSENPREPDRVVPILIRDFNFDGAAKRWIHDELISLWHNLHHEHEWTNGNAGIAQCERPWSTACEGLAERIKSATALVGPVSWRNISIPQITDGWFAWANDKIGIENPKLPTTNEVRIVSEAYP